MNIVIDIIKFIITIYFILCICGLIGVFVISDKEKRHRANMIYGGDVKNTKIYWPKLLIAVIIYALCHAELILYGLMIYISTLISMFVTERLRKIHYG